jgi:Reverse transcriptase (RNA-dependent DNA polymerase)
MANELTIKIVLTLLTLADWQAQVIDVKGAFLKGRFTDGEKLYLKIPQGFKKMYSEDEVLHLNQTIYGLKQEAVAFGRNCLKHSGQWVFSKVQPIHVYILKIQQMDLFFGFRELMIVS